MITWCYGIMETILQNRKSKLFGRSLLVVTPVPSKENSVFNVLIMFVNVSKTEVTSQFYNFSKLYDYIVVFIDMVHGTVLTEIHHIHFINVFQTLRKAWPSVVALH